MRLPATAAAIALTLATATAARAAEPVRTDVRAGYTAKGELVRLSTTWGDDAGARLRIAGGKPITLHDGDVAGTLVAGHERIVIALAVDDADAPFRVLTLAGKQPGEPVTIERPGARHDLPFAVAATATPDGFAVFFQEVQRDDPSAAHTYLVTLDAEGAPIGAATEVPVPWSLAAAAWNGDGFHLGLIFSGDAHGMRLSMVALTRDGQPIQHPDWASRGGFIADVHLIASDGKIRAVYRGGPNGDRALESDVTVIGQWGSDPAKAKDRGALPWTKVLAITDKGRVTKVAGGGR